jgi:hypothetical protein
MILSWREQRWQFRKSKELTTKIRIKKPRRFRLLARTTPIFLLAASIVEPEKGTLPDIYNKYFKVFSKKKAVTLPPENVNHKINL